MSSSSSKPTAPPSENPQLQLGESISVNISPDPGNSSHAPQTGSPMSSNDHVNLQNGNQTQTVTFSQVFHYWWSIIINVYHDNHNIITSPTPMQIFLTQNVYPLVTPMRIICFTITQISFLIACGFFMQTELYKSYVGGGGRHHHILQLVAVGHTVCLTFIMFFNFPSAAYERYMHHSLVKSLEEFIVMLFESLLLLGIGHNFEVAGLVAFGFLTIDALCIINLLKPGHHYSLLEAPARLTLHLGCEGGLYSIIPAVVFILAILVMKNLPRRHIGHAQEQAPTAG